MGESNQQHELAERGQAGSTAEHQTLKDTTESGDVNLPLSKSLRLKDGRLLAVIARDLFLVVVLSTLSSLLSKYLTVPMINYPNILTIWSIIWVLPQTAIYAAIQIYRGQLQPHQVTRPTLALMGFGVFLALGWLLNYYGVEYTPGGMQTLMNQTVIPTTMLMSYLYLGTRYRWYHYLGMLMVLAGIGLAISDQTMDASTRGTTVLVWTGLYVASWLPFTALTVYAEKLYTATPDLDPLIFYGVISALLLPVLIPLSVPFSALSQPPMCPSQFLTSFRQGTLCLVGMNSLPTDQCWPWAPILFPITGFVQFIISAPFYNLAKNAGSDVLRLGSALALPLTNIVFALPFLPNHMPFTPQSIAALLVIVTGMLVYGYGADTARVLLQATEKLALFLGWHGGKDRKPQEKKPQQEQPAQ